jgi:segregation and condensation protein B
MATLEAKIEALLAVSPRPLSIKKIAEITGAEKDDIRHAAENLSERLRAAGGGVVVVRVGDDLRIASSPEVAETVTAFIKDETTGELTRAQLETLTVIAYRGPITKAELEQIRGVNCTMILRNLMMRGLAEEESANGLPHYSVSMEFMRFLGVTNVAGLPDYEMLRSDKRIEDILDFANKENKNENENN